MINNIIQKILNDYRTSLNPNNLEHTAREIVDIEDELTNLESLLMHKIFMLPYFEKVKFKSMFLNHSDNIRSQDRLSTRSENKLVAGGSLLTNEEKSRLSHVRDVIKKSTTISDQSFEISYDDVNLVKSSLDSQSSDVVLSHLAMFKFYNNYHTVKDYTISYTDFLGSSHLLSCVDKACKLVTDFKYSSSLSTDTLIRNHLLTNETELKEDMLQASVIKSIVAKENETLKKIINKKLKYIINTPNVPEDDFSNTAYYEDLSPILNNPSIRNGTNIGILFDSSISGPEKLFKIYEKNYFEQNKLDALNVIEYQLSKPSIEDLSVKYETVLNSAIETIVKELPIVNTNRDDNLYFKQNDLTFEDCAASDKYHKFSFAPRNLMTLNKHLINASPITTVTLSLMTYCGNLIERDQSTALGLTEAKVFSYDNGIENLLTITARYIGKDDIPLTNKPKICIVNQLMSPQQNNKKTLEIFNKFVDEHAKKGITVIVNTQNAEHFYDFVLDKFVNSIESSDNVFLTKCAFFEKKLNTILDCIDRAGDKITNSDQSLYIVKSMLEKFAEARDEQILVNSNYIWMTKAMHQAFDELLPNLDKLTVTKQGLKM